MRYQVAQNIKNLQNQQHKQKAPMSTKIKNELKIAKRIKDKLVEKKDLIIKVNKGNSIVIMYRKDYEQKVMNFIFAVALVKSINILLVLSKKHLEAL